MSGFISYPYLIPAAGAATVGGEFLAGETDSMGIDFTYHTDITKQHYISDLTTPANNYNGSAYGKLTYTSPSLKLCRQSDGVWRYVNHNYVTRSELWDDLSWVKDNASVSANSTTAPDGISSTADTLTASATTAEHRIYQDTLNTVPNQVISVYAKAGTVSYIAIGGGIAGFAAVFFLSGSGTVSNVGGSVVSTNITSVGSGWYRCQVMGNIGSFLVVNVGDTAAHAVSGTSWLAAGTETVFLWGAQSKRYPVQDAGGYTYATGYLATPNFAQSYDLPYEWNAALVSQGILVEEARTNLVLRSQEFDNASWTTEGASITANATTSPDGTSTADKLKCLATETNFRRTRQSVTISSGAVYTWSIYAKAGELSWLIIDPNDGSPANTSFDLTNGVTGTVAGGCTASIVNAGNGWYRCIVTKTSASTSSTNIFYVSNADNTTTFSGTINEGIYIWGATIEAGGFPTSPIHTIAATVTRAVDNISLATTAMPFSTTVGTLVSKATVLGSSLSATTISFSQSGSSSDFMYLNSVDSQQMAGDSTAGPVFALDAGTPSGLMKTGGAFANGDAALVLNGGTPVTDATWVAPLAGTQVCWIGAFRDGISPLNGYLQQITYLKRRATNAELQTKTS